MRSLSTPLPPLRDFSRPFGLDDIPTVRRGERRRGGLPNDAEAALEAALALAAEAKAGTAEGGQRLDALRRGPSLEAAANVLLYTARGGARAYRDELFWLYAAGERLLGRGREEAQWEALGMVKAALARQSRRGRWRNPQWGRR